VINLKNAKTSKGRQVFTLTVISVLAIVMCALLSSSVYAGKEIDISDSAMKKLEDKLKDLDKSDKELKAKIANAEKDIEKQMELKTLLDEQISITEQKIESTNALIIGYQNEIRAYADQIAALELNISNNYDMMLDLLCMSYMDSNYSYIEIILGAKDIKDFIMRVERVGCLLEYQNDVMENMNLEADTLTQLKAISETYKANSEKLSLELVQAEKDLVQQKKNADALITKLKGTKTTANQMLKSNADARDEFDKMIEEILEERQRQLNAKYVGGDLMWPLDAKYTRVSSGFGYRTYDNSNHLGIDIPADYGAPVYASAAGTVATATEHWSYGNYVLIDHGGGIATLYAHNSSLLVKAGDKVTQGQQIAKCGSTGQSSGNHVHYEIRVNGKVKNPLDGVTPSVIKPGAK